LVNVPDEPKPYNGKKFLVEDTTKAVKYCTDKVALFQRYKHAIPLLQEFASLSKEVQRQISQMKRTSDDDYSEVETLQSKISKLETKLRLHESVKERCDELKQRLKKLKKKLKNEKALKLLIEGYSDKSIKKMVIEAISNKLMALVNQYARIVFPEDYKFTFDWIGSNISLKVHRRYGKRTDVSDVRKLSGAESKLFTIILVLALLSFVPKKKRLSFIVLDEPAANFSRETAESFVKLLPYLNKVIPSIIIVTPDSEERYAGAREFTVIKTDGVAKLVEGHPDNI
jgi:DNA repair exonuclease SbcCD ATPase subunit